MWTRGPRVAFSEIELRRIEQDVGGLCKRRSPTHLKDELSLQYRIKGHDVEVFERRPAWGRRGGQAETPVAKLKFVRTTGEWRLYWMRRDLKWHRYETTLSRGDLPRLVKEIDEDPHGCFFG